MGVARRLFEDALAAPRPGAGRAEALAGLAFVVAFEGDQPRATELSRRALEEGGEERARASAAASSRPL